MKYLGNCHYFIRIALICMLIIFPAGCDSFSRTITYKSINIKLGSKELKIVDNMLLKVKMDKISVNYGGKDGVLSFKGRVSGVLVPAGKSLKTTAGFSCRPKFDWPDVTCTDYSNWKIDNSMIKLEVSQLGSHIDGLLSQLVQNEIQDAVESGAIPGKYSRQLDVFGPILKLECLKKGLKISVK